MKKTIALLFALLICSALSFGAFADLWIPPIDDGGYCEELEYVPGKTNAGPLNRFASELLQKENADPSIVAYAEWGEYRGNREYYFWFLYYKTTGDPEACYALESPKYAENAEIIGYCNLRLTYNGDLDATQFEVSDFSLTDLRAEEFDEEDKAFYSEIYELNALPDVTETKAVTETAAMPEAETEPEKPSEVAALPSFETVTEIGTPTDKTPEKTGFWTTGTILVAVGVAVLAIGAGAAILLIKKKTR